MSKIILSLTLLAGLGLTACTNPYDPGQRALGGGLLGAGAGAGLGAIAGGGSGAAVGAVAGGALGAIGGAATTPTPPPPAYGYNGGYNGGYAPAYAQPEPAYRPYRY